jgi:TPR repeat protein
MIERSEGVVENIMEAVRYYRMSAEQACREAMFKLAVMSHPGRQVEKDLREAIRLYKLAAQDGHVEASFALC